MPLTRIRRLTALTAVAVALFTLAACGSDNKKGGSASTSSTAALSGPSAQVEAVPDGGSWAFKPPTISVASGTRVTWVNKSNVPHNVVFDDPSVPDSELFSEGQTYSVAISKPGTYTYVCTIHPGMKGDVVAT